MSSSPTLFPLYGEDGKGNYDTTAQYKRTSYNSANSGSAVALEGPSTSERKASSSYGGTVTSGTYYSNSNTKDFVVINRVKTANNVVIDVGVGSSGGRDSADDIVCIETGDHSSKDPGSKSPYAQETVAVTFNSSRIDTGNGNNLIALGTDTALDGDTYKITFTGTSTSKTFSGFTAAGSKGKGQAPLQVDGSTFNMGSGADTLVAVSTNNLSVLKNNNYNLGNGSDIVCFANSANGKSLLGSGNVIKLSAAGGTTGDGAADTLVVNGSFDTAKFTNADKVKVEGFDYGKDVIWFGGKSYTSKADIDTNLTKFTVTGS